MKKLLNDPDILILAIVAFAVIMIRLFVNEAEAKPVELRNNCGRFKVKNKGEFVTYADSVYETTGGVVYFDGPRAGHSFGDVVVTWVDCSKKETK
jgi:hypothetical protein